VILCLRRNSWILGQCWRESTLPMMPPERHRIAFAATSIPIAVPRATGSRGPGKLSRFVPIQSPTLANPPRVPAKNPAIPPLKGPPLTMTPATSPAMKGPISGRPTPRMRLTRKPTPMPSRRSAVLSRAGEGRLLGIECSVQNAQKFPMVS